ncbi:hypothetical protein [Alloalcanivorax profundimaris]|uniref:hypothetical protein n=1 Tax=Alloalcanivorax profundimaris TaxID=2735259 RepID=UPI0018877C04|nr:hypothetical protein [Alloalcanivorax profundimaris]MBF1800211.1 hypothetical protein [Alloalcanivorax profundimaris]
MLRPGSPAWRGLALLCWAIGLAGIFAPQDTVAPVAVLGPDVLLHAAALAAMTGTARLALPGPSPGAFWTALVLIAINLEVLQHLIQPSRFFSYYDMAANLAGVGLAAVSLAPLARRLGSTDK